MSRSGPSHRGFQPPGGGASNHPEAAGRPSHAAGRQEAGRHSIPGHRGPEEAEDSVALSAKPARGIRGTTLLMSAATERSVRPVLRLVARVVGSALRVVARVVRALRRTARCAGTARLAIRLVARWWRWRRGSVSKPHTDREC